MEIKHTLQQSLRLLVLPALIPLSNNAVAQALEDFMACANYPDRVERVFCLERALDSAVSQREEVASPSPDTPATEAETFEQEETELAVVEPDNTNGAAETDETAEIESAEDSGFRLPIIGNLFGRNRNNAEPEMATGAETTDAVEDFGRQARVVRNENGEETLFDVITGLDKIRPDIWQITLASGQVWRQVHVKRFNLREGEGVRIYPTGWGDNYRLETERLSGFIQVGRVD